MRGATAGQTVQILLGDAATGSPSFDNQAANTSANEVRTVSASSVNGLREARGDISATVVNDTLLQLTLTAPAGPIDLGSDITYAWQACNTGARDAAGVTLNGSTQVYMILPIPSRTVLKSGQTFPAGTLYTTSALTTAPLSGDLEFQRALAAFQYDPSGDSCRRHAGSKRLRIVSQRGGHREHRHRREHSGR